MKKETTLTAKEQLILFCFNQLPTSSGLKLEEINLKLSNFQKGVSLSHEELDSLLEKKFLYFTIDAKFKRVYFKAR